MVYYGYHAVGDWHLQRLKQFEVSTTYNYPVYITEYSYLIPSWVLTKLLQHVELRRIASQPSVIKLLTSISFAQTNKTWSWLNFLVSYQPVRQGRVHLKSPSSNSLKNNFGCITCIWYRDHLIFPIWKGISHERGSGGLLVQTFCFRSVEFQILSVFSVVSRHG